MDWLFARSDVHYLDLDAKFLTLQWRISAFALLLHLALGVLFGALGSPALVAYSLFAAGVFVLALVLIRQGRPTLGSMIGSIEANIHMFVVSLFLGREAGFEHWAFVAVIAPLMGYRGPHRWLFAVLPVVWLPALHVFDLPPSLRIRFSPSTTAALNNGFWWGSLCTVLLLVIWFDAETRLTEGALEGARARTAALLDRVLPRSIARRLLARPQTIADSFDEVTVLFADIAGFTGLSAQRSPEEIVTLLNRVFGRFDELVSQFGVEKIKTIGDAYMCVSGAPQARADHADAIADLALAMVEATCALGLEERMDLGLRVGVHTGPAVAGVIGNQRFVYDLWGDSVNTASRMESHGVVNRVQVSEATYEVLKHRYAFEPRGTIDIKGKGPMNTWFLIGPLAS